MRKTTPCASMTYKYMSKWYGVNTMSVCVCACGVCATFYSALHSVTRYRQSLQALSLHQSSVCLVHTRSSLWLRHTIAFLDGISSMLVYIYMLNHTGGMPLSKGIVGLHTPGTLCSEPVCSHLVQSLDRMPLLRSPWICTMKPLQWENRSWLKTDWGVGACSQKVGNTSHQCCSASMPDYVGY